MPGVAYRTTFKRLCEFTCLTFGCIMPDAEDAVHDAYVQILAEGELLHEIQNEELLLCLLANSFLFGKKRSSDSEYSTYPIEENPEGLYIEDELNDALTHALSKLTSTQKCTLYHRYVEDETPANIAKLLNQSSGSVRKRLHDSIVVLRDTLRKAGHDNRDLR